MTLDNLRHVYFLGIGGIGMSALARYFSRSGIAISGYDRDCTELTKKLEAEGMRIHYHEDPGNIPLDIDLLVYTPAIPDSHPEFVELKGRGLPVMKRSEALQMALTGKRVIAVAGTHGKTTTSAFLAHILNSQDTEVTSFVGGVMVNGMTNFIFGEGDWVIIEADEYDRSFLRLDPEIALIQAMDADHLDIYGSRDEMTASFVQFTERIKPKGSLWLNHSVYKDHWDEDWSEKMKARNIRVRTFGWDNQRDDVYMSDLKQERLYSSFVLNCGDQSVEVDLNMPGRHNALNATGAASIALDRGMGIDEVGAAIKGFKGIKRRFEVVLRTEELVVIDDYAHHPAEIDAVIETVRAHFEGWKLTVVFQPHLYSRTRDFMSEFAMSLDQADAVYLLPVYPARETLIPGADAAGIMGMMVCREKYLVEFGDLSNQLEPGNREVLLFVGAGDIYRLIPEVVKKLTNV